MRKFKDKQVAPIFSGTSCVSAFSARLVLSMFMHLFKFSSSFAGVQPVGAGEQEGSRVEEEGRGPGHREADLRRLLASGELLCLFGRWSQHRLSCVDRAASGGTVIFILGLLDLFPVATSRCGNK